MTFNRFVHLSCTACLYYLTNMENGERVYYTYVYTHNTHPEKFGQHSVDKKFRILHTFLKMIVNEILL